MASIQLLCVLSVALFAVAAAQYTCMDGDVNSQFKLGGLQSVADANACQAQCDATPQCAGVVFGPQNQRTPNCQLYYYMIDGTKTIPNPTGLANSWRTSCFKVPTVVPWTDPSTLVSYFYPDAGTSYHCEAGRLNQGAFFDASTVLNAAACESRCTNNAACGGFIFWAQNAPGGHNCYLKTRVQIMGTNGNVAAPADEMSAFTCIKPVAPSPAPLPPKPIPQCSSRVTDLGSNGYYLAYNVESPNGVLSVVASWPGASYMMRGPDSWGSAHPSVFALSPTSGPAVFPLQLRVTDRTYKVETFVINAFANGLQITC